MYQKIKKENLKVLINDIINSVSNIILFMKKSFHF